MAVSRFVVLCFVFATALSTEAGEQVANDQAASSAASSSPGALVPQQGLEGGKASGGEVLIEADGKSTGSETKNAANEAKMTTTSSSSWTEKAGLRVDPMFDDLWQNMARQVMMTGHGEQEQKLSDSKAKGKTNVLQAEATLDEVALRKVMEDLNKMKITQSHQAWKEFEYHEAVTLTYQSDCGRYEHLKRLAKTWNGPISAALLCTQEDYDKNIAPLIEDEDVHKRVDVHLCLVEKYPEYYPINKMRNVALDGARSRRIFLVDADEFVQFTENDAREAANAAAALTEDDGSNKKLFPEDESLYAVMSLQWDKEAKDENPDFEHAKSDPQVILRHAEYPTAYGPQNFDVPEWMKLDHAKNTGFNIGYEPYFISLKPNAGMFDERFVGWGGNKAIHLVKLHLEGAKIAMVPRLFTFSDETRAVAQSHNKNHAVPGLFSETLDALIRKYPDSDLFKSSGLHVETEKVETEKDSEGKLMIGCSGAVHEATCLERSMCVWNASTKSCSKQSV